MTKFYITTPIYYPSGKFHIGTAYTEVLSDTIKRYHKLKGEDTFLLTGTDEHGQKIEHKAEENNMSPKDYVDIQANKAKELWKLMKIDYDKYIRTTDEYHEKAVQEIFERFLKQGDIYKGEYEGWYCEPDETFYTEKELVDGKCPECGRKVIKMKEEAYFFKMSKYTDRLLKYYDEHPDFIKPDYRKTEMINNFIKPGLQDLCVTRTSFDWGIKVKSDPKHIVYVWLDALTNYITALGYPDTNAELFKKYWPADVQVVGKDIARFHLIYWPIFLMALDLPIPKTIYVHNWITMKDGKMSKSKGNVIYPEDLINRYGLDATKYFLIRCVPTNQDGLFTPEEFVQRYNSDLANDLSNLLNRTISMVIKYKEGIIPEYQGQITEYDKDLEETIEKQIKKNKQDFESFEFSESLEDIWTLIHRVNKYIDETQPWNLYKENKTNELDSTLNHLIGSLKVISRLIRPLMEETSDKINKQINQEIGFDYKNIKGKVTQEEPIFMRLEKEKEINYIKDLMK